MVASGRRAVQYWVLGSVALMALGAFGPWVKALGQSVGGTDGSNDGWLVVAAAALGGLLFYLGRQGRSGGVWAFLGGAAGVAVTLYDRSNVQDAIDNGGAFTKALVQVGWGLNLALAASASLALAGIVYLLQDHQEVAVPITTPAMPFTRLPSSPPPASPPDAASAPPIFNPPTN